MGGKYLWRDGDPLPVIDPHSEAKHRVLKAYLLNYIKVLTVKPGIDRFRLALVDGFAGGGLYRNSRNEEHEGSPFIMARTMYQAQEEINAQRQKGFQLDPYFFFVDEDKGAIDNLRKVMHQRDAPFRARFNFLNGTFTEMCQKILEFSAKEKIGRILFVLDQYGWSQVNFEIISIIFKQFPDAEVILTFAVDALCTYFSRSSLETLRRIGLVMPEGILCDGRDKSWRYSIQSGLIKSIVASTGARYHTTFFIRSSASPLMYWLTHLSMHHRARDVMMGIHWQEQTHFIHHGKAGLYMFGYDPAMDEELTRQPKLFGFDAYAKELSLKELGEDFPRLIYDAARHVHGISFQQILEQKFNDTPADIKLIKESLGGLIKSGDIFVITPDGNHRRSGNQISPKDVLKPNKQLRLFLP